MFPAFFLFISIRLTDSYLIQEFQKSFASSGHSYFLFCTVQAIYEKLAI